MHVRTLCMRANPLLATPTPRRNHTTLLTLTFLAHGTHVDPCMLHSSRADDHVYLRRNLGVDAVPWPGLASQLARVRYTGGDPSGRREVLFCCGGALLSSHGTRSHRLSLDAVLDDAPTRHADESS